ncbi:MAG: cytochrome c [Acidobacteria bacterium]|nr:cytochrome c [Acidobacteriota bacterium]
MKHGLSVLAIVSSLVMGVTVAAQEGGGRGMPPPSEVTTMKVPRTPVKTVKIEVPIEQAVRHETPEFRGEGLFFQRCAICHVGDWRKEGQLKPYGPQLTGVLKDASREAAVRTFIRSGSLNMPGFQHTFTPAQFDDLIAYLKTL